jgi:hypothetical protein
MLRTVLGSALVASMILAGCAPGPPAPPASQARNRAREDAEIAAQIAREKSLDQLSAKFDQQSRNAQAEYAAGMAERSVGLGEPLKLGGLEVTAQRAEFRKIRWRELNEPGRSFDETPTLLVVTLRVKNVSSGQFKPASVARVTDNLGSKLKSPFPELSRPLIEGSQDTDPLPPGQEATVLLCIQPKNRRARWYQWEISTTASDHTSFAEANQRWQLKFDASEIQSSGKEPADGEVPSEAPEAVPSEPPKG